MNKASRFVAAYDEWLKKVRFEVCSTAYTVESTNFTLITVTVTAKVNQPIQMNDSDFADDGSTEPDIEDDSEEPPSDHSDDPFYGSF